MKKTVYITLLLFQILIWNFTYGQNMHWSLKACIDTAIQRNITLQEQHQTSSINKINLEQAQENLYPNLLVTDAPGFNFGNITNSGTGTTLNQNITTNNFAVTSTVTLYNGSQFQNIIREYRFIYNAGVKGEEKTKNDISLNILAAYLQILVTHATLSIAQYQLKIDSNQVYAVQKYVSAGKYPESSLLQIQSQLAQDNLILVNSLNQLTLAKVNLMQLMNLPVNNEFDIEIPSDKDTTASITALSSDNIYKAAESFLPEIKGAELNTSAMQMQLNVSKGLYLPKLTLSGSLRTYGSSLDYLSSYSDGPIGYLQNNPGEFVIGPVVSTTTTNNLSNLWDQTKNGFNGLISLNLSIPIFNNFIARNQAAISKINITSARLNEEAVKIQLRQTIEQAYTDLTASISQYNAAREALRFETRTYDNLEKKFDIGLSSATDYLIEKSNLNKAQIAVVQAKYTFLFRSKLIDFYLGKSISM